MTDLIANVCWACVCGLFEECMNPTPVEDEPGWFIPCGMVKGAPAEDDSFKIANPVGRPMKDPDDVTDVTSTGRKRAKMLAPILDGMICEWSHLKFAGGGIIPILGCDGNEISETKGEGQGDRHHGPDKNVLNNSVGVNLHRICTSCHHRWHALNDSYYGERPEAKERFIPEADYYGHDPITEWTNEEYEIAEEWWSLPTSEREEYPFYPDETRKKLPGLDSSTLTEYAN